MKLTFKFLDPDVEWNVHASIITVIILSILKFGGVAIDNQTLVFSSILAMMNGSSKAKAYMTIFLSLLVYHPFNLTKTLLLILGVLITNEVKSNNIVQETIMNNKILLNLMILSINIWMIYFSILIINDIRTSIN